MDYFGRNTMGRMVSLRAALALVFLLMSALQPGLFAGDNPTGFHSDSGMTPGGKEPATQAEAHRHAHGGSSTTDAAASEASATIHHQDGKSLSDQSCEVHCAPFSFVTVSCQHIERIVTGRLVPEIREAAIPLGEYNTPVRPPRTLI